MTAMPFGQWFCTKFETSEVKVGMLAVPSKCLDLYLAYYLLRATILLLMSPICKSCAVIANSDVFVTALRACHINSKGT